MITRSEVGITRVTLSERGTKASKVEDTAASTMDVNPHVSLICRGSTSQQHGNCGRTSFTPALTVLNAVAFASLVLCVDRVTSKPRLAAALLVLAIASFVALVRREMPRQAPLIPLDLLRSRPFRISVIASVCCFAGQMASYIALPFYLEHSLGEDALATGLYMTPWPLVVAFAGPISGRLADRVSNGLLCAAGGVTLAIGLTLAALWPIHGNLWPLVGFLMLSGAGFGIFQTPNNRNMLLSAPRERSGAAGGMQGTARLLGQTLGSVIMTLLFTLTSAAAAPRIGLAVSAVFALAGGLVSVMRIRSVGAPDDALRLSSKNAA